MKMTIRHSVAAVVVAGMGLLSMAGAEEPRKTLPTLLIKGEVVSLDSADPSATLFKVKDRYGFETPIYLTPETKIAKGDQALAVADLTPGTAVEVEYSFDINTAKRHAVRVAVNASATSASPAPAPEVMTPPIAPESSAPEASTPEPVLPPAPSSSKMQEAPAGVTP